MKKLIVCASLLADDEIMVKWYHTDQKCGLYTFKGIKCENKRDSVIKKAEAYSLIKIIEDRDVFPEKIIDGENLEVLVCHGQTKKIILGKTKNKEFLDLSSRASLQLEGVTVKVDKKEIQSKGCLKISHKEITDFNLPAFKVETPLMGVVTITNHALQRYKERIISESGGACKRCLRSLIKRLSSNELKKKQLSKKVMDHKKRKYGGEVIEAWSHPTSTLDFGLLYNKNNKEYTLVTVFVRKD